MFFSPAVYSSCYFAVTLLSLSQLSKCYVIGKQTNTIGSLHLNAWRSVPVVRSGAVNKGRISYSFRGQPTKFGTFTHLITFGETAPLLISKPDINTMYGIDGFFWLDLPVLHDRKIKRAWNESSNTGRNFLRSEGHNSAHELPGPRRAHVS